MRILIEPGSAHCRNVGDMAMLQVAYRRFRKFWQDATFHIVTSEPEQLAGYCPRAFPLEITARNLFLEVASPILRIKRRLPNIFFVRELEFSQRRRLPGMTQTILSGGIWDFRSGRRVSRRLACQFVVVATGFRSDYRWFR
jgi:hypothetical protein